MSAVYLAIDETVNSVVYPFIVSVLVMVLIVLGVPLGSFWGIRWAWYKKYPPSPDDSVDINEPPADGMSSSSLE